MAVVTIGVLLAGSVLVVLVTGKRNGVPSVARHPATVVARQPSIGDAIMQRYANRDGVVDFEGALQLFSYAFAPLPGITLPAGAANDRGRWVDVAADLIATHLGELTDAQRSVVLPYFTDAGASTSATVAPAGARPPIPDVLLGHITTMAMPLPQVRAALQAQLLYVLNVEGAKLGHTLFDTPALVGNSAVHAVFAAADLVNEDKTTAPMWTVCTHGPGYSDSGMQLPTFSFQGKIDNCYVFFGPAVWSNVDSKGNCLNCKQDTAELYHEVFHCYQGMVIGSVDGTVARDTPAWVKDGGADWAAAAALGFDEPAWKDYLTTPGTPLADRSYDAFGLFFEIEYVGRPLWPQWWQIWTAASQGGWGTSDWFNAVAGDRLAALTNAWGASWFQDLTLGHDWGIVGPPKTTSEYKTSIPTYFSGGSLNFFSGPYNTKQVIIPVQSPGTLVIAISLNATFRLEDGLRHERIGLQRVAICWGSCKACTISASPLPPLFEATGDISWALTSLQDQSSTLIQEVPSAIDCKRNPKPSPPCSRTCPGSNGDPHVLTVDYRRYDFQAAGEYVLLRSSDGSLEVQGRQEPIPGANREGVTINTAVAARVGTHRVGVYTASNHLDVHLDGSTVSPASPLDLGNGGKLVVDSVGVEIDFPDGTKLWALSVQPYGINIQVLPSAALRTSGAGVLGTVPTGLRFPPLPDGTGLHFSATPVQVYDFEYQRFAAAWRVTNQNTLFDYGAGKSTATYSVAGFAPIGDPRTPLLFDPVLRAMSETTCQAINDVDFRDNCVFDVTTSGNSGFAAGYQSTESFQQQGTAGTAQGGTALAGVTEVLPDVSHIGGSVLGTDGRLYATIEEANAKSEIVAIDPASASISTRATLDAPGGLYNGLVSAAGSLWFITATTSGICSINRVDPGTLQAQATISLAACPTATPAIAAVGDTVWTNSVGPVAGQGRLLRFDPSTNQLAGTVPIPTGQLVGNLAGTFKSSDTSLFWGDDTTIYRLQSPWTSAVNLNTSFGGGFPSGDGLWFGVMGNANLYGGAGGQQASLAVNGELVGADAKNVYVVQAGPTGDNELWGYPVDGSSPAIIASTASGTIAPWLTGDATPFFFTAHDVLTLDLGQPKAPSSSQLAVLDLIATALG